MSQTFIATKTFADCGEISSILGSSGASPDPQRDRWKDYKPPEKKPNAEESQPTNEVSKSSPRPSDTFEYSPESPVRKALDYIGIKYTTGIPRKAMVNKKLKETIDEYNADRMCKDLELRELAKDRIDPIRTAISVLKAAGLTDLNDSI